MVFAKISQAAGVSKEVVRSAAGLGKGEETGGAVARPL
jgi:hypothetical protein